MFGNLTQCTRYTQRLPFFYLKKSLFHNKLIFLLACFLDFDFSVITSVHKLFLHRFRHVSVELHRDGEGLVAEPFRRILEVYVRKAGVVRICLLWVYLYIKHAYNLCMKFEWDDGKDKANREKHGVSFAIARQAFADPSRIILEDVAHSKTERRFFCIGMVMGRVCTVRFTMRGPSCRIFGAGYWRSGRKLYEREKKTI